MQTKNTNPETTEAELRDELATLENRRAELSTQLDAATDELNEARAGLVDGSSKLETVTGAQATATALTEAISTLSARIGAKRSEIAVLCETQAATARAAALRATVETGLESQKQAEVIFMRACADLEATMREMVPLVQARNRAHEAMLQASRHDKESLEVITRDERDAFGYDGTSSPNPVLYAPEEFLKSSPTAHAVAQAFRAMVSRVSSENTGDAN